MFSANQITGFFNRPYHVLLCVSNSHKLKVDQKMLGCEWSKMVLASLVTGLFFEFNENFGH